MGVISSDGSTFSCAWFGRSCPSYERDVGERDIDSGRLENCTLFVRLGAIAEEAALRAFGGLVEECCGEAAIITAGSA